MKQLESTFCPTTKEALEEIGVTVKKGLSITIPDSQTIYEFHPKNFINAKEALIAYRNYKKITKYKVQFSKCWAFYQLGRLVSLPRSQEELKKVR